MGVIKLLFTALVVAFGFYLFRVYVAPVLDRLRATAEGPSRPHDERRRESGRESPDDPFEVLGISPSATATEIRDAYRRQIRENHPDRVMDMPADFQELADGKTKAIRRAYETLQQRGRV